MREETATARAPWAAAWAATASGTSSVPSSTFATKSTGLAVSEPRSRAAFGASSGTGTPRTGRPDWSSEITSRSQASSAAAPFSPPRACLATRSTRRSACSRSASTSSASIVSMSRSSSTLTIGVDHVLIAVGPHHVDDRVGLADVGEELVAEALAFVRARHQPGDVVEVDRVPHDL